MKRKVGKTIDGSPAQIEQGKVVAVAALPRCNFCDKTAEYDFKTTMGPWANGCYDHYRYYSAYQTLGTGQGQLLVAQSTVEWVYDIATAD
jgi:hypothetical protein